MRRQLGLLGVLLLTLSCLSPVVSIYGAGADVLLHVGTGAAAMFICAIGVAVVWAVIYAELGSAYPYAGGEYVAVGSILGPWAGFASLTVWSVTAGPADAFLAKTIAIYCNELVPTAPALPVALAATAAATAIALLNVRSSALVTGLFLSIEMLAVLLLIAAGLLHPARGLAEVVMHPVALGTNGVLTSVALGTMALAGVSAAYATTGGNQAIVFGEELVDPHRKMGHAVLLAGLIGALATAIPVIAVVMGAGDLTSILKSPAPFGAFMLAFGGPVAADVLSAGVILAMFNALIVTIMFYARLFFSLGRDEIFNPAVNAQLMQVHRPSSAPRTATLVVGAISAACCVFNTHLLLVFISGLTVYSLALVSLAVFVGRGRGLVGKPGYWRSALFPLAPVLGLILSMTFCIADLLDPDAGRPSVIVLGAAIAAGVLWHHLVLRRRTPPWTPRVG